VTAADPQRPPRFRAEVRATDVAAVAEITRSTGFFNPEELAIAVELVEERLSAGLASGYLFLFAEDAERERVLGYTCFGPIAGTEGSFDLYWIATHRDAQRRGVGRLLLAETERRVREAGGRRLYVETSGRALYAPTQAFYAGAGYAREAELADFYAPGDAKVFYVKPL
jgi:ribosomal protein S18 acetylase RimI-like enzyme